MTRKSLALPTLLMTALLSACGQDTTDRANPRVSLNAVASVTKAGEITVSAQASDNVAVKQVEFYLDDAATPFATDTSADASNKYTASLTWAATQNGTHTVKAVAVDTSGNRSAASTQSVTVDIVTDTVKPEVSISGVPATVTAAGTYTLSATASDNVAVTSVHVTLKRTDTSGTVTTLYDQTGTATTFTYPLALTSDLNGTYTLTVSATDAAANTGSATQTVTVNIPAPTPDPTPTPTPDPTPTPSPDNQAPTVTISVPSGTLTTAGDYTIGIGLSDNVGVTTVTGYVQTEALGKIDLSNLSTAGGTATIPVSKLFNGVNTIYITATDAAGNVGKASASVTVAIP